MKPAERLVIFTDMRDTAPRVMLPALLHNVRQRRDMECVAIVCSGSKPSYPRALLRHWLAVAARSLQVALGSGRDEDAMRVTPLNLNRLARENEKSAIRILDVSDGNPNHPRFLRRLQDEIAPTLALNLYCRAHFGPELLSCFERVTNYHNGALPQFRGLRASNWSIYQSAQTSGYSFHLMDEGIDAGNVLEAGEIHTRPEETPADLDLRKARAACRNLPAVLEKMIERNPGLPQTGVGCEHTREAHRLVTEVRDPRTLSRDEWEKRLSAFLRVRTRLDGKWIAVTGLDAGRHDNPLAFRTADGQWVKVSSIDFWPAAIAKLMLRRRGA